MLQPSSHTLTEAIKSAVRSTGKSVSAVARESGVSQPALHRFLAGQRGLTLHSADRLCPYLRLALQPLTSADLPTEETSNR
jgi:hypothetical protein